MSHRNEMNGTGFDEIPQHILSPSPQYSVRFFGLLKTMRLLSARGQKPIFGRIFSPASLSAEVIIVRCGACACACGSVSLGHAGRACYFLFRGHPAQ